MKKLFILFFTFIFCLFSVFNSSCKDTSSFLLSYVSELRSDILVADKGYNLKARYGYRETPYLNDAKVGEHKNTLTFILEGVEPNEVEYYLIIPEFNDCKLTFSRASNGNLYAELEREEFELKSLAVRLCYSDKAVDLTLTSIIPENVMDINQILLKLQETQENLITHYLDGLEFKAEIYARILNKNERAYWYVAFADGNALKAFLVDGISGEVLAIREVF